MKRDGAAWLLQINLIGPMLAIQIEALVLVRIGGGTIVCTASVAGLRSGAGSPAYSASKAGVINLVTTAAQQLSGTNVRVNGCPGLTETGMTKPLSDSAAAKGTTRKLLQLNPLWRAGQPEKMQRQPCSLRSAMRATSMGVMVHGSTVRFQLHTSARECALAPKSARVCDNGGVNVDIALGYDSLSNI